MKRRRHLKLVETRLDRQRRYVRYREELDIVYREYYEEENALYRDSRVDDAEHLAVIERFLDRCAAVGMGIMGGVSELRGVP